MCDIYIIYIIRVCVCVCTPRRMFSFNSEIGKYIHIYSALCSAIVQLNIWKPWGHNVLCTVYLLTSYIFVHKCTMFVKHFFWNKNNRWSCTTMIYIYICVCVYILELLNTIFLSFYHIQILPTGYKGAWILRV